MPFTKRQPGAAEQVLAAFRGELLGGRPRWVFSILAAIAVSMFIWTLRDPQLEIWFPLHAEGMALRWLVGIGSLLWVLLAAINWRNWHRSKPADR